MKTKRLRIAIIAMSAVFIILLVLYLTVILPAMQSEDDGKVDLDLLDGEVKISDKITNFYIYEPIDRSQVQSVKVVNREGSFEIYRDSADNLQLRGAEDIPLDSELFSSFIVTAGKPVAMSRIAQDLEDGDWSIYGLDDPQASWTIRTTDGTVHTLKVGDMMLSRAGYYVSLEGRNAVYIMGTSLDETMLGKGTALLQPLLVYGMTTNDYYLVRDFMVMKGTDMFVGVERLSADDAEKIELALIYPLPVKDGKTYGHYDLNSDTYLNAVYSLIDLKGTEIMALNPNEGVLMEYGLMSPAYTVYFTFGNYEFYLFFSEEQSDGSYYAMSNLFGYRTICRVDGGNLSWLKSREFSWIQTNPFYENISEIRRITITGGERDVSADFVLTHGTDAEGNVTLEVRDTISDTVIKNSEVRNFRQFYLTLLNITNKDYSSLSEEDRESLAGDSSKLMMTMVIEKTDGSVTTYEFFRQYEASTQHISTGKVFVTVNGFGEFYTVNDLVDKVLNDIPRVLDGLDIDGYGQY